jgi:hypothetical protein
MVILGVILFGWSVIRPLLLTRMYGPELREAIERFERIFGTVEGQTNPAVMAQIATGDKLEFMVQLRCISCRSVRVATKTYVEVLDVLEYSPTFSLAVARIEWGWHSVSPITGAVDGSCHAEAYTNVYPFARENGVWKMTHADYWIDINPNRVDDTPDLLAKYCGSG